MEILVADNLRRSLNGIKDRKTLEMVEARIRKIIADPGIGKPLRYCFKGERTVRIGPMRLVYSFSGGQLVLLRLLHRKGVYVLKRT